MSEPKESHVPLIVKARFLALAAACAAAAAIALPAAAVSDSLGDALGVTGNLQGPIGQTSKNIMPPLAVAVGTPQVSVGGGGLPGVSAGGGNLVQLNVGGTPPAGGGSGSQPSSSPQSQPSASSPAGRTSAPAGNDGKPTGGGGASGSGRDPGGGSSRKRSARARGRGPTSAGAGSTLASNARGPAQDRAGERGPKRSIATRIVDRIPAEYRKSLLALAAIAVLFGLLALHESRRSRHAREDALGDALTGLANREGFELRLDREWRRAVRYERELGLLLLDLDGFKEINDTQGHMAGDRVLREAAAAISGRIRETDFAARYGGDEFVVLCPETADRGLKSLADGLEEALRQRRIEASVGFSQREPSDSSPHDIVARADASMYKRKRASAGSLDKLATAEA